MSTNIPHDPSETYGVNLEGPSHLGRTVVFDVEGVHFTLDADLFIRGEDSKLKTRLENYFQGGGGTNGSCFLGKVLATSPASFESFIWGINSYNSHPGTVPPDEIERFVSIVFLAGRYGMKNLEAWACTGLRTLALGNEDVRNGVHAASLLHVFILSEFDCSAARAALVAAICDKLALRASSPWEIAEAISLGIRFGLPRLAGLGYYAMLMKPREEWAEFGPNECLHLRAGGYDLINYSLEPAVKALGDTFAQHTPALEGPWFKYAAPARENERRVARGVKCEDVLGRLRNLLEDFLQYNVDPAGDDPAVEKVKAASRECLENMIEDIITNELPKFFGVFIDDE